MDSFYEAWLVLDEVDGETARFRIIADAGKGPCTFIEDDAELVDGELFWERRELTPSIEPPVDAYDLWFRVLFVEGGAGVGGEVHVLADLRAFDAVLEADPESQAICPVLAEWGTGCEASCPDGDGACLDVRAHQMTLEPTLAGAWEDLPRCGLDATDPDAQVWSCNTDWDLDFDVCSTSGLLAVGWPGLVLALGILRRRRS